MAKAAAENFTPVTLELGGKSPVIVDEDYSLERAAATVAWAKLFNGGQVCVSPDYVLVPRGREKEFAIAAREAARKLYPKAAGNPQYTAILNQRHYDRITGYITDAQALGAEVITAEDPELGRQGRQLPLTMIINPPADSTVMQDEIFGPVLPIIGYDSDHARSRFREFQAHPAGDVSAQQWKAPSTAMADPHPQRQRCGQRPDSRLPAKRPALRRPGRIRLRRLPRTRRIRRHVTSPPSHVPTPHLRTHRRQMLYPPYDNIIADVLLKLMRRI